MGMICDLALAGGLTTDIARFAVHCTRCRLRSITGNGGYLPAIERPSKAVDL
jgi:hypothetical protein